MSEVTMEPPDFEYRQKMEVIIEDGRLEGDYVTFVEQPRGEEVTLQVPRIKGLYLPLKENQSLKISYKKLSARYEFDEKVTGRDDSQAVPCFKVNKPKKVKRIQMRDYLRVPCELSAKIELVGSRKNEELPRRVNGKIVDISGGGVKFKTAVPVPSGQNVHLEFKLPLIEEKIDFLPARVIRRNKDEMSKKYFLGIEFTGISKEDRNDIIQYVYRQQIEMDKQDKWVQE